ncbi:cell wall metabolism sensor histidine kinase WalK [Companilactobacillus mishanensis]|uniref:histidine kinase n=1 Tax=Companilactobacillus mishanensis TaxID=2486008 RepID=A0A5P0ZJL1_9LACO|nr:cell wall metabolism sensor histidine kinase WalK [Companilactobacillus mishanensis]MQS52847.1 cell wall metabolism sensor histidine kinase WalK [Companilactobacillus mishanensis]MQS89900.1 cell wall metabolism sensor histidine kinase WalK [Companilactobacillus mishanensis]
MKKRFAFLHSINFKIALSFILILIFTIEIIGAYFVRQLEEWNVSQFESNLVVPVYAMNRISENLNDNDKNTRKNINTTIQDFARNNSDITDIQVVDRNGVIVGTKDADRSAIIGRRTLKENIKQGISTNKKITQIYYDRTLGSSYESITPVSSPDNSTVVGAIYVKASMESVYQGINNIIVIFLTASLVAGLLGAIIAIFISRAITRPIGEMKQQAVRMAEGDYSGQVRVYSPDELGQLAMAVNDLSVKVEEATENSESERRRLDSVLTQMSDGVIATNRLGNITVINEMAREYLNKTEEEANGAQLVDILGIGDNTSFDELLENPEPMIIETTDFSDDEEDYDENDDNSLILNADFSLIQRNSGFISGMVCVLHDVTEQQKIDSERRQFVSNVSHELRTPLTSISSYIDALNNGAWKDQKLAPQFLNVTAEETDRMIRMIQDLLNLSRMDQGRSKLDKELVNFNEFFSYILDRFDMMLKKEKADAKEDDTKVVKNYRIKRIFTNKDLWVEIDTDKMTQVVDNIMNNAIKYSPDGGVITCRLLETNKHIIISVSDEGLGIPRKDIKKVFDRFYRVDKARSRKQGGTGLGLSISKEIVEQHKGRIWVNSAEGRGSTFYISLPFNPNETGGEWDEI